MQDIKKFFLQQRVKEVDKKILLELLFKEWKRIDNTPIEIEGIKKETLENSGF